ncbi:serine/threonine-protein kinase pakD-like isoform X2 [Polistes fuscatus]|uniref:serine/threonine-protein kinase pakD-like isoform X2 n=1 Tax=Polistes fuscatus TaxID=30207 RepID=UPI001CA9321A|nr:serine/threonine-protein kinase pakD-like isoform X2 [Polistes fuscatus]
MSKKNRKRKEREINWEEESYFPTKLKEEMKTMWEIPQIYQFLHLTKDILNVPNITIYEMERMLLIPRASKQLANIMTCLLSYSNRSKMNKVPPMPYEFWTNILMHKLNNWFKHYQLKHMNVIKVLEIIGVEPEFWNVFPDPSLFAEKNFEDLSFKQRVWLLKTLCDCLVHSRKIIQERISNHSWEDQEELILGTDSHGATYIYFPQFISTELRIYRHCMNNTILSTAKPVKVETTAESEAIEKVNNSLSFGGKVKKSRKRKSNRWQNGYCPKIKKDKSVKSARKKVNKKLYICNCSNSAINRPISEDLHLSLTSSTSNNNNNNNNNNNGNSDNNNLSINNLDKKRMRNSSKMFDESTMSTNTSDYETNVLNNETVKESTFKGFSTPANEKGDIVIINQLLNKLKTEIDINHVNSNVTTENTTDVINDAESSTVIEDENITESILNDSDSNRCNLDNLSNNSKTDDEKLNEIIVTGNTTLMDKTFSNNSEDVTDLDSCFTSKSDDEKLNETETSVTDTIQNISNDVPDTSDKCSNKKRKKSNNREIKNANKKLNVINNESVLEADETQNCIRKNLRLKTNLQMEYKLFDNDISNESQITDIDNKTEEIENKPEVKNENASFRIMLNELGVSNFLLVADSVETLRKLISSFSSNITESPPSCEELLVNKLKDLLKSVEEVETILKDTTKKAKAKLLKEWTNFKIGYVVNSMEDQDSSSENGVSSNWWILGSQDNELSTANDESTLQTLSNITISSTSIGSRTQSPNNQSEKQCTIGEEKNYEKTNNEETNNEETNDKETNNEETNRKSDNKDQEGREHHKEKNKQDHQQDEECIRKEEGEQTRRVLRARGVSSYTEHLYPYDEIDESELDEWTNFKIVDTPPSTQISTSTSYSSSKNRHDNNWSEKEDSDQDWTLPGSRKRKNKRSPNNKKRKSFQIKNLNKKITTLQDTDKQGTSSSNNKDNHSKEEGKEQKSEKILKIPNILKKLSKKSSPDSKKIIYPQIQENSVRTVSPVEAAKIGYVDSVHSELNIKDETPIIDSVSSNQCKTNYTVPEISYFVQPNSIIPNIVPTFQQHYYMQEVQPDYVVYNQQSNFLPIQQVPCIVTSQQIVSHPSYIISTPKMDTNVQSMQKSNEPTVVKKIAAKKSTLQSNCKNITKPSTMPRASSSSTSQKRKVKDDLGTSKTKKKFTSLIILSDSDDEIEILNEKIDNENNEKEKTLSESITVPDDIANSSLKNIIPQEFMQRINQGCISITPIKSTQQTQSTPTQLVVVVNETGNYYALALPNGSKLILTPEQVAQIRASNGGKLVL